VLRQAVLDLVGQEHRRVFPPTLHVGTPGGQVARFPEPARSRWGPGRADLGLDGALRSELVAALLTRVGPVPPPLAWLTRPGPLAPLTTDAPWVAAVTSAFAEAGLPPVMLVVTRQGWVDPRSGHSRRWRRLRTR
jgi:hypothetical protein